MGIYTELKPFLHAVFKPRKQMYIYDRHKKYARIAAGFDIETTRIETHAFMYHWQVSMNDEILLMRRWDDFTTLLHCIDNWCKPKKCSIIMWVANLGHEFAFLQCRYKANRIFATDAHTPLTVDIGCVQFRECLTISGQGGLANLAKNYCKTQKLKGDLNYDIIRNSLTPIFNGENGTDNELQYMINDVKILSEWANYIFKEYSDKKLDIPLTRTSIVRFEIKSAAEQTGQIEEIRKAVNALFPKRETYNFIMQFLFRGGYVHANIWHVAPEQPLCNVIGVDFTSSYPAVMLHKYYPMTPFVDCSLTVDATQSEITDDRLQSMCVWFVVTFYNIERTTYHAIESEHKIISEQGALYDNGRMYYAEKITVAITEIDYEIYKRFYKWERLEIMHAMCSKRGKLPEYVLKPLRKFYKVKQRLKGTDLENSIEYKNAKAAVNSFYGCMVTRLKFYEWFINDTGEPLETIVNGKLKIIPPNEWYEKESEKTYDKLISKQILSPYWGIYVTAHARYNLLSVVSEIDIDKWHNDVIYCDTDSIYMFDTPENRAIIEKYNLEILEINKQFETEFSDIGCFSWVDTDKETGEPEHYIFKTLGAKRYLKYYNEHAEITVSGMKKGTFEKKIARVFRTENSYVLYENMKKKTGKIGYIDIPELFDKFNDNFILACDESLKLASNYEIEEYSAEVTDSYGNTEIMHEYSGVALVPVEFSITMDDIYTSLFEEILKERRLPIWK